MQESKRDRAESKSGFDAIQEALALRGQPEQISSFYDKWASSYDSDVQLEDYVGPERISRCLERYLDSDEARRSPILDVGCGTGRVGLALRRRGFVHIEGVDLCHAMVAKARETGAYRVLRSGCDLNEGLREALGRLYHATLACGLFTTGHVQPPTLARLVEVTQPGGLIVVSTRKSYCMNTGFPEICAGLENAGVLSILDRIDDDYLAEEGAHYWVLRVTPTRTES